MSPEGKKKKGGGGEWEGMDLGLMHPNRLTIMTFPAEAEKQTRISIPTFHLHIRIKLEEKHQEEKSLVCSQDNEFYHASFIYIWWYEV